MDKPLMECGHAANATNATTGAPSCAICVGLHPGAETPVRSAPDLTGRQAQCYQCDRTQPSSFKLPFFEYRGPGSHAASKYCKCWYAEEAHLNLPGRIKLDHPFVAHGPHDTDTFYCGCRGWS